jgi:protein TonB
MTNPAWQDRDEVVRWSVCLLIVAMAHVGGGLLLVSLRARLPAVAEVPAVMLDLAPLTAPPPAETPPEQPAVESDQPAPEPLFSAPPDVPPPEPPVAQPPPDIPLPEPLPEPVLEPPPPAPITPEVPLPPKPPPPKRLPPVRPAAPRTTPVDPAPPVQASPASPAQAAPSAAAVATWQSRLLAHLTRFKRYPPTAQMRREQGVALLRFRMTPAGQVVSFKLERSSGHALLDQETLDLIQRAQPLPALPNDMPQQPIELVVPLRYELR